MELFQTDNGCKKDLFLQRKSVFQIMKNLIYQKTYRRSSFFARKRRQWTAKKTYFRDEKVFFRWKKMFYSLPYQERWCWNGIISTEGKVLSKLPLKDDRKDFYLIKMEEFQQKVENNEKITRSHFSRKIWKERLQRSVSQSESSNREVS